MKILAIGNSFSQDATTYLQKIAQSAQEDLFVRNCYIGGCSLKRHVENAKSGESLYDYQENGEKVATISLQDALRQEKWDFVTLQQASHDSGKTNTYRPYLGQLIRFVHALVPQAKIVFHQTWAYEIDSTHPCFGRYGHDQQKMYGKLRNAIASMAQKFHLPVIEVGAAVQKIRKVKEFDYADGGLSLNRDGFHLTFDYGRYLAGLVWFSFFTGRKASEVSFAPEGTDPVLIAVLKNNL